MAALDCDTELDIEWVELIKEAQNLGLSMDEIRDFLNRN
ncbi:anti-repressor SinI family protein [Neobacillus mesonae]|nr:anti-repressor SinI family protein [Neobacillus mesonae]MCM3568252.1 anti-repressor SinI family protein [Neobacillus mesonae]